MIIAILVAAFLFVVIKVIRFGLKQLLNRYTGINFIENIREASGPVIWIAYVFWATDFLFKTKFYYQYLIYALILIVAGFLAWFLLRDIFAGIIFRVMHNLKNGSYVRAGDLSGQIKSQQLSYLKILTADGQLIRVPYSKISREVITELAQPGALEEHILRLLVDLSIGTPNAAESLIRDVILNSPWSNFKEEQHSRNGDHGAGNEKAFPSQVFRQKARRGRGHDPGYAHEACEQCVLCGREFFVCNHSEINQLNFGFGF